MIHRRKLLSIFLALIFLSSALPAMNIASTATVPSSMAIQESDATMLAEDLPNEKLPKSLLVYTEFADHDPGPYGELKNTLGIVNEYFSSDYNIENLTDYSELNSVISNFDVLLIPEQEDIYQNNITDIGAMWSTPLFNFVESGGVIVLLDCFGANVGDGPGLQLLNETGLISVFSANEFPSGTLTIVDNNDALGRTLPSSFPASDGSVRFEITDGTSIVNDTISTVVAHKTIGAGHIALLGFDFWEFDEPQKLLLRNAIQLSRLVVFDQSHNPYQTIQAGYLNYSIDLVDQGYAVASMPTFSPETLAGCDVLVMIAGSVVYNTTEVAHINTFVDDGGGLFIITEFSSFGDSLDPITDHFGFVRNKTDSYLTEVDTYDTYVSYIYYNVTDFEFHSILLDVARVEFDRGGGFVSIPDNGVPLIRTDTDNTSFWSDGTPADGVIISAAASFGFGRVAVMSDVNMASVGANPDADADQNYYDSDNEVFLTNFIHWSAGGGEEEKIVLFDESHSPNFYMNASYFGFARFLTDNGYTIRWNYKWDSAMLDQIDVLVIQDGDVNYTANQIDEIKAFVATGGGLCLLAGQTGYGLEADLVGNEFGMDLNNTGHIVDSDDYDLTNLNVIYNTTNFGNHPIMDGITRLELYYTTAFLDIGSGTALVTTDNDGTSNWNDGSPADNLVIMSALEYDLGRVFFSADYMFPRHNSDFDADGVPILYDSDNDVLLSNVFKWLTENRAPAVELLTPTGGESIDGVLDITWDAIDPNKDPMTFALFYSSTGGPAWILIDVGITAFNYLWDTSTVGDGVNYLILVVAYDDQMLSDEDGTLSVFTIDNNGPDMSHVAIGSWPTPELPIPITVDVIDISGVDTVLCNYTSDGGSTWTQVAVAHDGDNTFSVDLGPFVNGTTVEYILSANDTMGHWTVLESESFTVQDTGLTLPPWVQDNLLMIIIIIVAVIVIIIIIKKRKK